MENLDTISFFFVGLGAFLGGFGVLLWSVSEQERQKKEK